MSFSPPSRSVPDQTTALSNLAGKKIAFISVFDKKGLAPLARQLQETYGYTLLSTGGTKKYLDEHQIPAIESSMITGFDELLGGRVKSLHPAIFAAILAEPSHRLASSEPSSKDNLPFLIDTVIVNLYPFESERERVLQESKLQEASPEKSQMDWDESTSDPFHLLHFIDIGGSALLRAAAKNYPSVNVLGSPKQYEEFLEALKTGQGTTTIPFRAHLARQAFAQSAYYDGLIQQHFMEQENALKPLRVPTMSDTITLPLTKITDLRYGENPHQQAALYGVGKRQTDFEALQGKTLSYNNILDMQAAWNIALEFAENPVCVIVKHNNPCGVALSTVSIEEAFTFALDTDPLSAFGGVVAFNQGVTKSVAKMMKEIFLEVIIAPHFEPGALDILSTKKNLRLVQREMSFWNPNQREFKQVSPELFLVQSVDPGKLAQQEERFKVATECKPTDTQLQDMVFAWKIVKHVKSNAIVLAKNGKTVGIGGGQTSRIGALENALKLACDEAKDSVMASDGFLPHEDNVVAAAHARVGAIIQPGGSIKDPEVVNLANQYKIAMVTTGVREFKH